MASVGKNPQPQVAASAKSFVYLHLNHGSPSTASTCSYSLVPTCLHAYMRTCLCIHIDSNISQIFQALPTVPQIPGVPSQAQKLPTEF